MGATLLMADYYDLLGVGPSAGCDSLSVPTDVLPVSITLIVNQGFRGEPASRRSVGLTKNLSDPQTRARYDQFGEAGVSAAARDMGELALRRPVRNASASGFRCGGPGAPPVRRGPRQGDGLRLDLNISFKLEGVRARRRPL